MVLVFINTKKNTNTHGKIIKCKFVTHCETSQKCAKQCALKTYFKNTIIAFIDFHVFIFICLQIDSKLHDTKKKQKQKKCAKLRCGVNNFKKNTKQNCKQPK